MVRRKSLASLLTERKAVFQNVELWNSYPANKLQQNK